VLVNTRSAVQFLAENLFRIEADSDYAAKSLPEPPCEDLGCDLFSRGIVITAGILFLSCIACVCFNNLVFYVAERTPGLPHSLRVRSAAAPSDLLPTLPCSASASSVAERRTLHVFMFAMHA
jgi:hypothetical protein